MDVHIGASRLQSIEADKRYAEAVRAAETNDVLENAQKKLIKKNADMIVANDVTMPGAGFAGSTNCVTLITRSDMKSLPMMSKRDVADAILDQVMKISEAE